MAGLYEKDTDYQALINAAVEAGNMKDAAKYEQQRNAKIAGEGITNHGQTSNYTDYLDYTPGIDYSKKAGDLYAAGDTTGAWNTLFGNTDSREAKISGIGTDYGKTSQSIWDELVANASSDNLMQQIQNAITQIQNQDYSYGGGKWDNTLDQLAQAAIDFNYDDWANSDQYKALADRYGYQGKLTMQDVLGQISSRTGGLASSYATTAAQQQYNDYMAQLENAARSQYADEKNSMLDNATLAQNMSESEYQRYLNEQSAKMSGQSEALTALYNLLGYQTDAENTEYSQGQDSRTDAQNRVYDYLVNQGGAVADLDADLITASGYTTAELNAMAAKYAQGMTAAAAKSSGGGSSGGGTSGNGMDYDGLFAAAQESGNPKSWLSQKANYQKYGFTSSSGLYSDYETWLENGTEKTTGSGKTVGGMSIEDYDAAGGNYQSVAEQLSKMKAAGKSTADILAAIRDAYANGVLNTGDYMSLYNKYRG